MCWRFTQAADVTPTQYGCDHPGLGEQVARASYDEALSVDNAVASALTLPQKVVRQVGVRSTP